MIVRLLTLAKEAAGALFLAALFLAGAGCLEDVPLPAPAVSIEPAQPEDGDDLQLLVVDQPSDLTLSVTWSLDGEARPDLADEVLVPASETAIGQIWSASATLSDGAVKSSSAAVSVEIGGGGDDDDTTGDDDDATGDDDDASGDDDNATLPAGTTLPRPSGLCAAPTASASASFRASTCTGPGATAPGRASSSSFIVVLGSTRPVEIEETR